jgi:hypothetical protein
MRNATLHISELSALDLTDIRIELDGAGHEGLTIVLDRSKHSSHDRGRYPARPPAPLRTEIAALRA